MKFQIITLFPEILETALSSGVVGQAVRSGKIEIELINPRSFTEDIHQTVDDRPYGGGDGMVLMVEPLRRSLESLSDQGRVIHLSPQGKLWTDSLAREWSSEKQVYTLICGRYAGIDQRFIETYVDDEISVGDYVLSGGEPAAWILVDSLGRLQPGVLGNEKSPDQESFTDHLLEGPLFTRPREVRHMSVPQVFLNGNHEEIQKWRYHLALIFTFLKRQDLWQKSGHTQQELTKAIQDLQHWTDSELAACGLNRKRLQSLIEVSQ